MPTVPIFRPSTNLAPMPGVKQENTTSPQTFGAGIAQAQQQAGEQLARTGGELSHLGAQIVQREDAYEAKNAYQIASEQVREFMHNPQTGLLAKRGAEARGATNLTAKEFNRIQSEVTKKLTPSQKMLFQNFWEGTKDSSLTAAARHEAAEIRTAEDAANDAILQNAESMVSANYQDPKAIKHYDDVALATIASKTKGQTEDVYNLYVRTWRTKAYGAAAAQMIVNGQTDDAMKFLDAHKDEIDKNALRDLTETVKKKEAQIFSQKVGDDMMLKYPDPDDEEKAMEEVRKMNLDADRRLQTENRVQALFADRKRYRQEQMKAQIDNQTSLVWASPSMGAAQQIIAAQKNPMIAAQMQQVFKMKYAEQLQEASAARSMARSIAMQEAAEDRRRNKENVKFGMLQDWAELDIKTGKEDPLLVAQAVNTRFEEIRKKDPQQAELYREYATNRVLPRLQRIEKADATENNLRFLAQTEISGKTRTWIDNQITATGRVPTESEILQYAGRFEDSRNNPILTGESKLKALFDYAKNNGRADLVRQNRVESILQDLVKAKTGAGSVKIADYPGLYEEVVKRIPPGSESVTDQQLIGIMSPLLVKGKIAGSGWLWDSQMTALEALKTGNIGNFVTTERGINILPTEEKSIITALLQGYSADESAPLKVYAQEFTPGNVTQTEQILPVPPGTVRDFTNWMRKTNSDKMTPEFLSDPAQIRQKFQQFLAVRRAMTKKLMEKQTNAK